ncbi:helix-turn-helix domain-containing protein [Burkholderia vietnamiensis]|uniref:helix-turn-helix domain-containing protein n=1 Tax=Burkholderia vietnamiensis TaxID=60552 RepID=UPI001B91411E|nr:helix-turn-helix domain-containing protein [Burkholderia vietnamiensis]MBR7919020.1 helix-turn-helix domain-containing protein [Burkholderia vietnamiensis]HDR9061247.1 helix-turn-helix domain-containing protein [Burkholderia vietnamiensis]
MTVQQFLARQRSGFVLARDLIAQMMSASGCTEAEAAAALEQLLLSAGDEAPHWCEWQGFGVPEELDERGVASAFLMLAELQVDNPLYDPRVSKAETYDRWVDVSPAEVLTHHSVWFAYSFCGFRAHGIYSLTRSEGVHVPEADAILGPAMSTAEPTAPSVQEDTRLTTPTNGASGAKKSNQRLTAEERAEIVSRARQGETHQRLADEFHITRQYVGKLLKTALAEPNTFAFLVAATKR